MRHFSRRPKPRQWEEPPPQRHGRDWIEPRPAEYPSGGAAHHPLGGAMRTQPLIAAVFRLHGSMLVQIQSSAPRLMAAVAGHVSIRLRLLEQCRGVCYVFLEYAIQPVRARPELEHPPSQQAQEKNSCLERTGGARYGDYGCRAGGWSAWAVLDRLLFPSLRWALRRRAGRSSSTA